MPQFSTGYNFGFAVGLSLLLSLGVAGAAQGLRPKIEKNKERDKQIAILSSLGIPEEGQPALKGEAVDTAWDANVKVVVVNRETGQAVADGDWEADWAEHEEPTLLPVFQKVDASGTPQLYAIYLTGNGLWGPISAYLAVTTDGDTAKGATFFAPKETPGLGAEIQNTSFESQFVDEAVDSARPIGVSKTPCLADDRYCVDGISGATLTSKGVNAMLEDGLQLYSAFLGNL